VRCAFRWARRPVAVSLLQLPLLQRRRSQATFSGTLTPFVDLVIRMLPNLLHTHLFYFQPPRHPLHCQVHFLKMYLFALSYIITDKQPVSNAEACLNIIGSPPATLWQDTKIVVIVTIVMVISKRCMHMCVYHQSEYLVRCCRVSNRRSGATLAMWYIWRKTDTYLYPLSRTSWASWHKLGTCRHKILGVRQRERLGQSHSIFGLPAQKHTAAILVPCHTCIFIGSCYPTNTKVQSDIIWLL